MLICFLTGSTEGGEIAVFFCRMLRLWVGTGTVTVLLLFIFLLLIQGWVIVFWLLSLISAKVFVWLLVFLSFEWLLLVAGPCFQPQVVAEVGSWGVSVGGCCGGVIKEVHSEMCSFLTMNVSDLLGLVSLSQADPDLDVNEWNWSLHILYLGLECLYSHCSLLTLPFLEHRGEVSLNLSDSS